MGNFLGYNNIIISAMPRNKTTLLRTNKTMNDISQTISQNFSDNFVADVAKGDVSKIGHSDGIWLLGN